MPPRCPRSSKEAKRQNAEEKRDEPLVIAAGEIAVLRSTLRFRYKRVRKKRVRATEPVICLSLSQFILRPNQGGSYLLF